MKTFISYCREDSDFVFGKLVLALKEVGFEPAVDTDIAPGRTWWRWVSEQISSGHVLVVVLTAAYQKELNRKEGACFWELEQITDMYVERTQSVGILLIHKDTEADRPREFRGVNTVDLRKTPSVLLASLKRAHEDLKTRLGSKNDATALQHPTEVTPENLVDLVQWNFDQTATPYDESLIKDSAMQKGNARHLLRLVAERYAKGQVVHHETWLDLGCGTGLVARLAKAEELLASEWLVRSEVRVGIDFAPSMLKKLKESDVYTQVIAADIVNLSPDLLNKEIKKERVGLIFANNVLHWLLSGQRIDTVLSNCYEVLEPGGWLAASVAARGTGEHFLWAYEQVMADLLGDDFERWRNHIDNPIGLQTLKASVAAARKLGFKVESANLAYEPVEYRTTDKYVDDAKAYGASVYLAPIWSRSSAEHDEAWAKIKERFRARYESELKRHSHGKNKYVHDQYMVYLLLQKPPQRNV